jgi:anthranilate synthase component 1
MNKEKDPNKEKLVCVSEEFIADEETPVSVFRKLKKDEKYCFLLESVEKGEILGRYSFIGIDPCEVLVFEQGSVSIISKQGTRKVSADKGPMVFLREYMKKFETSAENGIPLTGGAIGYLGYDIVRYFEDIPDPCEGDEDFPEGILLIVDALVVFDHIQKKITVIANSPIDGKSEQETREECLEKIERIKKKLDSPSPGYEDFREEGQDIEFNSNVSKEVFMDGVIKAKEYIKEGDIFQVVLSQRLECRVTSDPFNIYRNLRIMNPSPYMFYFEMDGVYLVGSSPEVLVRYDGRRITLRPIAGTRKRGQTPEEDEQLAEELLADEKERAEHLMLIDLGRNDVGRVSKFGTVTVDEEFVIERYSHVMHIVSNVVGKKQDDRDVYDVFQACFPAGTLSGAPKVRAMEIISEVEPTFRGPYGGAVGYFSFTGRMDTCITIRTITIKDSKAYIQAGAGIVADSDPEREYVETLNKAKALMKAIQGTKSGASNQ